MAAASGPVAVDAERASGYRYSQRAYLVQLRREGAGTALVDPIALPALDDLNNALADAEWILHAASQDLACLAEVGLHPQRLFDTELAGRLLGDERVALGTMVEQHLGVRLEKGHSAADWSTRPLPRDWLVYAALDVELLIALRDVLADLLAAAGKDEWARAGVRGRAQAAPPPPPRIDPWRRTSGIHTLRNRRQLAVVRSLWYARDAYAAQRDVAPGRLLPDSPSSTLPARCPSGRPTSGRSGSSAARGRSVSSGGGSPRSRRARAARGRTAAGRPAVAATASRRPRAGATAIRWRRTGSAAAARSSPSWRRSTRAGAEPARLRRASPPRLAAAAAARRDRGARAARRTRCPPVAGRPDCRGLSAALAD